MSSLKLLKNSFQAAVNSVLPDILVRKALSRQGSKLLIANDEFELKQNVYVFGFGKAVVGMVKPIEELLMNENESSHLITGTISVPKGIRSTIQNQSLLPASDSKIEVLEGAKNNIPDEDAFQAAKTIVSNMQKLNRDDLVILLISGGGSALLPYPKPPLSLGEKSSIIKELGSAGADIVELNTVRKALSETKGGKLAANTDARIISLILSDVINNPLDIIASGPTVPNTDTPSQVLDILSKYNISVTNTLKDLISQQTNLENSQEEFGNVRNYIIGDNSIALESCKSFLESNYVKQKTVFIATSSLSGDCATIADSLSQLSYWLLRNMNGFETGISDTVFERLCIKNHEALKEELLINCVGKKEVFIVFGGETTVNVTGKGKGGRNQETALTLTIKLKQVSARMRRNIILWEGMFSNRLQILYVKFKFIATRY